MKRNKFASLTCPLPIADYPQVLMAHGGGGRLMHQLIQQMFVPSLTDPLPDQNHDGVVFRPESSRLAFTTDSFVVRPLFFPGGDIGSLAIFGTVNDLAMCGAHPRWLSVSLILEEGLAMDTLWSVVQSMHRAAAQAGVRLVTGDTKVVDRGKGDGIFINTSGIGTIDHELEIHPAMLDSGHACIVSGDLGRHGIAVLNAREELALETEIESDCAPLAGIVSDLIESGIRVRCMRDLTRGGLAAALTEIAEAARVHIQIDEGKIPVRDDVRGACEVLGLDPVHIANEGRFVVFVPAAQEKETLEVLLRHPGSEGALAIGSVRNTGKGVVTIRSAIGVSRVLDLPSGEQLPRIC